MIGPVKNAFDRCPACQKENALAADAATGRFKCVYCGHETLPEARGVPSWLSGEEAQPVDAALAAVTGEKLPEAPAPAPRPAADLAARRDLSREGHVRAIAGWMFVLGLTCLAAMFVYPRMPDLRRYPLLENPAHVYSRLAGLAILHLTVAAGLAGYHAWARIFLSTVNAGLFCAGLWMVFDAVQVSGTPARIRAGLWFAFALANVAVLGILHTGSCDRIFTKNYRLLVRESRGVRARTLRSPCFWLPLAALVALGVAVRFVKPN